MDVVTPFTPLITCPPLGTGIYLSENVIYFTGDAKVGDDHDCAGHALSRHSSEVWNRLCFHTRFDYWKLVRCTFR